MTWRLLNFQNYNIFENMAIDEAVFQETIKNHQQPTIRFYASTPAALSIGYFQDAHKELNIKKCRREKIDIARRITGGKAVFHFNEITYSIAAVEDEKIFPADIMGTYKIISQCIARGLNDIGIRSDLAADGRRGIKKELNPCCFSSPSRNELLVNGRKICGSAQVRKRGGFLQHGLLLMSFNPERTAAFLMPEDEPGRMEELKHSVTSVQEELGFSIDKREICSSIQKGFMDELGIDLQEDGLTPSEEKLKEQLLKKYGDDHWNLERKKYFMAA